MRQCKRQTINSFNVRVMQSTRKHAIRASAVVRIGFVSVCWCMMGYMGCPLLEGLLCAEWNLNGEMLPVVAFTITEIRQYAKRSNVCVCVWSALAVHSLSTRETPTRGRSDGRHDWPTRRSHTSNTHQRIHGLSTHIIHIGLDNQKMLLMDMSVWLLYRV